MNNKTVPAYFYFTSFLGYENVRIISFVLTITAYFVIVLFNVTILLVVFKDSSLHEPMYLLMSCLLFNSLYGSSALFPRLSADLLSTSHTITRPACYTQLYVVHSYAISEFAVLSLMSYDRYVAISEPLRYHNIMTQRRTFLLILCAFSYSVLCVTIGLYLSVTLPLCGNKIPRLYCSNWSVVRLSCVSTLINNIWGFFVTVTTVFLPAGFILYSYIRILIVCRKSSAEFRGKALQTCLPHIVSFVTYSIAVFSDIALGRYESGQISNTVALIISLEYIMIPPLLNPLIYGLSLPDIRRRIIRIMISLKVFLTQ